MTREVELAREVGQGLRAEQLPANAPLQAAEQRARAAELRVIIAALPLLPGDRVLDATCADGLRSASLAERVSPGGAVMGFDTSPSLLTQARAHANSSGWGKLLSFKQGDYTVLPFNNNSFDMVWCDWSRLNPSDRETTLREVRRVVRPGGNVALFATNALDRLQLPWPPGLRAIIEQAHIRASEGVLPTGNPVVDVDLCDVLSSAGLGECTITSYTTTRYLPLSLDERTYLTLYIEAVQESVRPYLSREQQEAFEQLCTAQSDGYLLDQPDFSVTYLDMVACARKV